MFYLKGHPFGAIRQNWLLTLRPVLIIVTTEDRPYVSFSRYIKQFVKVNDDKAAILKLKDYISVLKKKAVVIACSDGVASAIDMNLYDLKDFFFLPGCTTEGKLTGLMNKETMSELARKHSIAF